MEKVVIDPEVAVKVTEDLMACENLHNRLVKQLGDALMLIASPGEDLSVPQIRLSVLKTVAEARQESTNILKLIQSLKRGELPNYCTV